MVKRTIIVLGLIFMFSCSRKKEPYYLFHIGRDAVVTDSAGKVLRDTFYSRVNLGYSYEMIKGKDTVFVPRYVTTVDWSRGLQIRMFAGMAAINPENLALILNFSPRKLTYMKANFQLIPEDFVDIYRVNDGYVIFTTMNIYHTDFKGNEKNMKEVYTSKEFYGFSIQSVHRIGPEKFLILGGNKFGIFNSQADSLIVIKPQRPSSPAFFVGGKIYRLEMLVFGPYKAKYVLCEYNQGGVLVDSIRMSVFDNQYRLKPYVFGNRLYIMSEKAIYELNTKDYSVIKKLALPVEYDSLWNVGNGFVVYSRKKNQIARIPEDLSDVKVIANNVSCEGIYVSPTIISCRRGDSTYVYSPSFKPISVYENVLFVKGDFIGTRIKDTLIIYRKSDTFLKIASPYYSYQRKLQEEEEKSKEKDTKE